MKRRLVLAALLAVAPVMGAGSLSAQNAIPAMQAAANANVCAQIGGTLVRAEYVGANQVQAFCRPPAVAGSAATGSVAGGGGGGALVFGGLNVAAVAAGAGLLAIAFAVANDSATGATNGTN